MDADAAAAVCDEVQRLISALLLCPLEATSRQMVFTLKGRSPILTIQTTFCTFTGTTIPTESAGKSEMNPKYQRIPLLPASLVLPRPMTVQALGLYDTPEWPNFLDIRT